MDNDLAILEDAQAAVGSIDRRYRKADFASKVQMKKPRDDAFNAYAKARLKLLADGILMKKKDANAMKAIREEIGRARQTQTILAGALKLVKFLRAV